MAKPRLNCLVILVIACLFIIPMIFLALMVERVPVCVDPNATIESDRILNCHEWEDRLVFQF